MGKIALVAINSSTRKFDKLYQYFVPEMIEDLVVSGIRVIVPFGVADKATEGYVFNVRNLELNNENNKLKSIKKVLDKNPILSEEMLNMSRWMKKRYTCTLSNCIKCMIPTGLGIKAHKNVILLGCNDITTINNENQQTIVRILQEHQMECEYSLLRDESKINNFSASINSLKRKGIIEIKETYHTRINSKRLRVAELAQDENNINIDIDNGRIKNIQQVRLLEILMSDGVVPIQELQSSLGFSPYTIKTLNQKGYIQIYDIDINREPFQIENYKQTTPMKPTMQQEIALRIIKSKLAIKQKQEILIHGVTGSGKTEVYLQAISQVIEEGRQAIVLVPEISLTPQMVERFVGRFGNRVAILHSKLSLGEKFDQWKKIRNGEISVIVGARSAVFAPVNNLGIVIIDEEHESSYKSDAVPKYHAKHIAVFRAIHHKALVIYGSATPSVELYYKAKIGEIDLIEMTERANAMSMPPVQIIDMRNELNMGNRSELSQALISEISRNLKDKKQTILFINRRGFSSIILCKKCGYVNKCPNCSISMTYHEKGNRLICHYCGYLSNVPVNCLNCSSEELSKMGIGTQRIEKSIMELFPECTLIRMDLDTTVQKNAHEVLINRFRNENIDILIGTQMIAKGHDFPNVTLVGAIAADSLLNAGDYKASERTFQLLTQVAGRAGRGRHSGRVLIQAYNIDDFSITTACKHDYKEFYKQEILMREKLNYPPFTNIGIIIVSGVNDRIVYESILKVKEKLIVLVTDMEKSHNTISTISVFGPARPAVAKIKWRYRWRIIIKCNDIIELNEMLSSVSDSFKYGGKYKLQLSIDINPNSMV